MNERERPFTPGKLHENQTEGFAFALLPLQLLNRQQLTDLRGLLLLPQAANSTVEPSLRRGEGRGAGRAPYPYQFSDSSPRCEKQRVRSRKKLKTAVFGDKKNSKKQCEKRWGQIYRKGASPPPRGTPPPPLLRVLRPTSYAYI